MPNILVTGATGLIGSNLLEPLAEIFNVHAISRSEINDEIANIKWHHIDLKDDFDVKLLPSDIEAIIYLAQSEDFRDFPTKALDIFEINTVKLLKLLDYGREVGVKKFIYASTGGVYGNRQNSFSEQEELLATGENGFYVTSKLCSEVLADNYKQFMDIVILRLFFVYGKMQKSSMLIPRLITNVRENNLISLQGSNGIFMNPIHVSDSVSSVLAALKLKGSHKINVAGPEVLSLKAICELIGNKVGIQPIFEHDMQSLPRHLVADTTNMTRLLVIPRRSMSEGLDEMVK